MANMAIRVAGCKPVEAVRVLFGALVFVIVVPDVHAGRAFLMREYGAAAAQTVCRGSKTSRRMANQRDIRARL